METHTALYRTYRPATFAEVIGQEHITSVLEAAIERKKVSHAYLFYGSRGTGKTTVARIFARALGTHDNDIYEMDAASNRRVEDFRDLNESTYTLPFNSPYKVYIIDEAHMLTKEAFNAFLKTLEEPPAHVVFILATTEPDKLPDTIVSRCQTFTFKKPSLSIIAEVITRVAKKEGYTLEPSAAELMALLSEGSFRDALGVLQKVLTLSSDKVVSVSEVETITNAPRTEIVRTLLSAIAGGDTATALAQVRSMNESGTNMLVGIRMLIERVRAVLIVRYDTQADKMLTDSWSEADAMLIRTLAHDAEKRIRSTTLKALISAEIDTYRAYVPSLPLELALVALEERK